MKKKHRANDNDLVKFILSSKLVNIGHVLRLLLTKMHRGEWLCIHQWDGGKWHIEVINYAEYDKAINSDARVGATKFLMSVDIENDKIIWNHDKGNCLVRGKRWFDFFADNWPKECDGNKQNLSHGRRMPSLDHRYVHLCGFSRTPERAA